MLNKIPILRNLITKITGIELNKILNLESTYGSDLGIYENNEFRPFNQNDNFILFELKLDSNKLVEETEDSIDSIQTIKFILYCYGKDSYNIAIDLYTNLLSSDNLEHLNKNGLYFEKLQRIESTNEFLNNVRFFRTDIEINFQIISYFKLKNSFLENVNIEKQYISKKLKTNEKEEK